MNKITKLAMITLLGLAVFSSITFADVTKGKNIFIEKLQVYCSASGINNGAKFASKHTQDEWESIKQAGKFAKEIIRLCPNAAGKLNPKYENDVYAFSYEYASDSGKIPSR